ncbi:alpha-L-fucosidase [Actinacidiphila sp. ITFR-21]|uniref:alpha-L-fucosidase n=1 Tax=Actinacidiphila sp. ITFR-21 TaxID=3075199 RepID=UPI00288AB38E|nr:alpha-L-fucosidase [Streptomyces sp. ITFR-21]WNI14272.1 alpha-L-fucosidase [Streptomyces sp. ITFR-21]
MTVGQPSPSRRTLLASTAAAAAITVIGGPARASTSARPVLPPPPHRGNATDMGLTQQNAASMQWYLKARFGMFLHWGGYSGPAQGEWYMYNAGIRPDPYRALVTPPGPSAFSPDAYRPVDWAVLAVEAGMRYAVLTTRHHEGLALFPSAHPDAWSTAQLPGARGYVPGWGHDYVTDFVRATRELGLRTGLYYSPINWRFPGYYDWTGTNCLGNPFGYTTSPANRDNARHLKELVYEQVRTLTTGYGDLDLLWWDGGWMGQQGTDADGAFFWEPGHYRDPANAWPVDPRYGQREPYSGRPLGLMGMVRQNQPQILATPRSGWIGDYAVEEGGALPTGPVRAQPTEKTFSIGGTWGYSRGAGVMDYDSVISVLVNSWVRDMNVLLNVGPDGHGTIVAPMADILRRVGAFLRQHGEAVYGTRGGPWNPVDGQVGYTYCGDTVYAHLLPGLPGTAFTLPYADGAHAAEVRQLATGRRLDFTVGTDGRVTVTGIDRAAVPLDTVLAVRFTGG